MKKSYYKALSRLLAGVMVVSSAFGTTFVSAQDGEVIAVVDEAVDDVESAVSVDTSSAETLETYAVTAQTDGDWSADDVDGNVDPDTVLLDNDVATVKTFDVTDAGQAYFEWKEDTLFEGYTHALRYGKNNITDAVDAGGNIKTMRAVVKVEAKADAKVTFDNYVNKGKTNYILKYDGTTWSELTNDPAPSTEEGKTSSITVEVAEGDIIAFAGQGTTPALYGVKVEANMDLSEAQPNTTDDLDFRAALAAKGYELGAVVDSVLFSTDRTVRYTPGGQSKYHSTNYGLAIKAGDVIEVSAVGNETVDLLLSKYAADDGVFTVTNAEGEELDTIVAKVPEGADSDPTKVTYEYSGKPTTLKFTYSGGTGYLTDFTVVHGDEYQEPTTIGEAVNFNMWLEDLADEGGSFAAQTFTGGAYGDSTLKLLAKDETAYTVQEKLNGEDAVVELDGVTHKTYKAGSRPGNCNDMVTETVDETTKKYGIPTDGAGTAAVFTPAGNGMFVTYAFTVADKKVHIFDFDPAADEFTAPTLTVLNAGTSEVGMRALAVPVKAGHTYVVCTSGQTNNFAFAGFEYVVDEEVTVPVSPWTLKDPSATYNFDNTQFTIIDEYLGDEIKTKVTKDTTSIKLMKGHRYIVKSSDGAVGVEFTTGDEFKADDTTTLQLVLEELPERNLTGEFVTNDGGTPDVTEISFTSMIDPTNVIKGEISADGKSYSVKLRPGDYNTSVVSGEYFTADRVAIVNEDRDFVNEVYLESIDTDFYDLPAELKRGVSNAKFENNSGTMKWNNATSIAARSGDKITIPVEGVTTVTVAGWYNGKWDINGTSPVVATSDSNASNPVTNSYTTNGTETEVVINILDPTEDTGNATTYLYWVRVGEADKFDPAKTTITVPGDFDTLTEAVNYINNLEGRPEGEEGRMTIELTADIEEQVVFSAPYVTLKGNGHEISWYYGCGTQYYSYDAATNLYSERLYHDKYSVGDGSAQWWGRVAIVTGDYFLAEDTTFRNTYNYEITEKAKEDIASGLASTYGDDVAQYKAKERSNAFWIEAKNIELYKCKVLSSQDTFGRNGGTDGGYSIYCKDCVIGGNVDYICGEFTAVFDNCELQWKSYTGGAEQNANIGFITAAKTNPYLFRDCKITVDNPAQAVTGKYGRTWGAGSNVSFIQTETNGTIDSVAWGMMSSGDKGAKFYEYENTNNGEKFESLTSTNPGDVDPAVLPEDLVQQYATDEVVAETGVLKGWVPVHYYDRVEVLGDADNDGYVTASDSAATLQYTLRPEMMTEGTEVGQFNKKLAEVSGNETIDSYDSALILQKSYDSSFRFPAEVSFDAEKN